MTDSEHRKAVAKAYQDALRLLRNNHDPEFHQILASLYEQRGLTVVKRRSRKQVKVDEIEAARRLLDSVAEQA